MGVYHTRALFICLIALVAVCSAELKRPMGIVSFGSNNNNRLGQGSGTSATSGKVSTGCPSPIGIGCSYSKISVNGNFVVAMTSQGDLFGWGNNSFGQLKDGGSPILAPERLNQGFKAYSLVSYDNALVTLTRAADIISRGDPSVLPTFQIISVSIPVPPSSPPPTSTPTSSPSAPMPSPSTPPVGSPLPPLGGPVGPGPYSPPFSAPVMPPTPTPVAMPISPPVSMPAMVPVEPPVPMGVAPISVGPAIGVFKREFLQQEESQGFNIDIAIDSMKCSATRCYFYNASELAWFFWGSSEYDAINSQDLTKVPGSATFVWMTPAKSNVVSLQVSIQAAGVHTLWAFGRNVEANPSGLTLSAVDISPYVGCVDGKLAYGDNEFGQKWRAESGDAFTIYACLDHKSIFGWGSNSYRQLGNNAFTDPYYAATSSHVKIDIPLSPDGEEVFWAIAAGHSTGYAFTSFNNTWGWGYASQNALNDIMGFEFVPSPVPIWQEFNESNNRYYQIRSVYASGSAHGLIAIIAMRWGRACALLDSTMAMADIFCDPDGFLNLPDTMYMSGAGSALMNVFMKMRGSMHMNGTSQMTSMGGMEMEGDVALTESSSLVLGGINRLVGNLSLYDASTAILTNVSLQIVGQADFGADSAVRIENALSWIDSSSPMIEMSGDANIEGSLAIVLTQKEVDLLVSTTVLEPNDGNDSPTTRRDFFDTPGGNSTNNSTLSGSRNMNVLSTNGTLRATGSVTVTLPTPSDPCTTVSQELQPTGSSLNVLFTVTSTPGCQAGAPGNSAKTPEQIAKSNRNAIIIACSIVGGVILLALLAALIILKVKPIRSAVLPYRDATAKRLARTPIVPPAEKFHLQENGIHRSNGHEDEPSNDDLDDTTSEGVTSYESVESGSEDTD